MGERFGFGRFEEKGDLRLLVVKLNAIMIDGVKIHANIPRFARKMEVLKKGDWSGGIKNLKPDFTKASIPVRN